MLFVNKGQQRFGFYETRRECRDPFANATRKTSEVVAVISQLLCYLEYEAVSINLTLSLFEQRPDSEY